MATGYAEDVAFKAIFGGELYEGASGQWGVKLPDGGSIIPSMTAYQGWNPKEWNVSKPVNSEAPWWTQGGPLNPINNLYTLGAVLNTATGGTTGSYTAAGAFTNAAAPTEYSHVTQWASGYQGDKPNEGQWGLPIVNPAAGDVAGDVAAGAAKVVDKTLSGFFKALLSTPVLIIVAVAGAAAVVGVQHVKHAPRGRKA